MTLVMAPRRLAIRSQHFLQPRLGSLVLLPGEGIELGVKDASPLGQGHLVPGCCAAHQLWLQSPHHRDPSETAPLLLSESSLCGILQWAGRGRVQKGCQSVFFLATLALHYEDSCLTCGCWAHAIENEPWSSYLSSHASACGKLASWRPIGYGDQSPHFRPVLIQPCRDRGVTVGQCLFAQRGPGAEVLSCSEGGGIRGRTRCPGKPCGLGLSASRS